LNILFLNPLRFHTPTSFGERMVSSYFLSPVVTFAQLASFVPNEEVEVIDGQVDNISLTKFLKRLKRVDIVAISIHSSMEALNCEINIRIIKKYYPKIKIIIGGYHATYFYKRWLNQGVDFAVLYEGGSCFKELIESLKYGKKYKHINNLVFKNKNEVVVNRIRSLVENLDTLPVPMFDIINFAKYSSFLPGKGYVGGIEIARGCPFVCSFCITPEYWNHQYRRKSNKRIMEELKILLDRQVRKIWFYTSNFGIKYQDDCLLCDEIGKTGTPVSWRTSVRVDTVLKYPDLIKKAADSGLKAVLVGYESLNINEIMDYNKSNSITYNFDNFRRAYGILQSNGIVVEGSFIMGSSDKSLSHYSKQFNKMNQVCDHLLLQVYRPNFAVMSRLFDSSSDKKRAELFYYNPNLSAEPRMKKILSIKRKILKKYYFNPMSIYRRFFHSNCLIRKLYLCIYRYIIERCMAYISVRCLFPSNYVSAKKFSIIHKNHGYPYE